MKLSTRAAAQNLVDRVQGGEVLTNAQLSQAVMFMLRFLLERLKPSEEDV
jgi:hypothetical protein